MTKLKLCIKKDPESYVKEFEEQLKYFNSLISSLKKKSGCSQKEQKKICKIIDFLSRYAIFFKKECKDLPEQLLNLLKEYTNQLSSCIRLTIIKSLIFLRNKSLIHPMFILPSFFELFSLPDKKVRKVVFTYVLNDVIRMNKKNKNLAMNKKLQTYIFSLLKSENSTKVQKSLLILIELFNKKIWCDDKTISVLIESSFSKHSQVVKIGLLFLLGNSSYVKKEKDLAQRKLKINTKRRKKKILNIVNLQKKSKSKDNKQMTDNQDFTLIRSLKDPQIFVERLFLRLKNSRETWSIKLLYIGVISRILAHHQVILFNFYTFIQCYLSPNQKNITRLLVYTAQAIHQFIPPEIIKPLVFYLAKKFVIEQNSNEAIAAGINTIRAICARQPLAINSDLLRDLVVYQKHKDKGVMMAARSLTHLYRLENPELLYKKDRGRWAKLAYKYEYGKKKVDVFIKGLELLAHEEQWKFKSVEELMTGKLLRDEDLTRIKQLRVKNLAEKYNVSKSRIVLNESGEIGKELEEKDIMSENILLKEKKSYNKKLSVGPLHWTEYMKKLSGTGTNKEKKRKKQYQMIIKSKDNKKNRNFNVCKKKYSDKKNMHKLKRRRF